MKGRVFRPNTQARRNELLQLGIEDIERLGKNLHPFECQELGSEVLDGADPFEEPLDDLLPLTRGDYGLMRIRPVLFIGDMKPVDSQPGQCIDSSRRRRRILLSRHSR